MRVFFILIVLIPILISCSSTYHVKHEDLSYNEINRKLVGEKVTLKLIDGQEIDGYNVNVKTGLTYIGGGKISTKTIKEITIKNIGKGTLEGIGIGVLSGFIIGGTIYLVGGNDLWANSAPVVFPILGFVLGGMFGVLQGDIERYIFPINKEAKRIYKIEISSIVEKTTEYIIISWKGKEIRLLSSEYNSIVDTDDRKQYIQIPEEVYLQEFK